VSRVIQEARGGEGEYRRMDGWKMEDEMMKMRIPGKGETMRKRWLNNKTIRDDYVIV
jgi:hypothetical protein